ncbi:MAG: FAD-dependent oxidoreductase, partial [Lentisphaerae bacterium]|nr:FAD-dependent oxidoreductase [Lentisphaerota bacterium]
MVYDLIILGGGPAGYLAGERAAHEGMKVLLIEERFIGGVCLNEGCIPSKAYLYAAKLKDGAEHGEKYGVFAKDTRLDHAIVNSRKDKVVKVLTGGVRSTLKGLGVEIVEAHGEIAGRSADGYEVTAAGNTYAGRNLLI